MIQRKKRGVGEEGCGRSEWVRGEKEKSESGEERREEEVSVSVGREGKRGKDRRGDGEKKG